jgi:hypothetical protein
MMNLFDEADLPPIDPAKLPKGKAAQEAREAQTAAALAALPPAKPGNADRFANLPPDVDALFAATLEPVYNVLQGAYPAGDKRIPLYVKESAGARTVKNQGAIMAHLYADGLLLKICGSSSVLNKPPSIAFQAESLEEVADRVKVIGVYVADKKAWYTVPFSVFKEKAIIIKRGISGRQWALPLTYWRTKQY